MRRKFLLSALFAAPLALGSIASLPNTAKAGCGCWPYSSGWSPTSIIVSMVVNAAEGSKCAVNPGISKTHQRDYCESCGWDYVNTGFWSSTRNYCKV
tara:strand:+ start:1515 stop:1805 length:291 start_codon:yes stop_codon:yes gene_type:complete